MASGVELTDIHWVALGLGMLANIALGFLWYAPFTPTGRVWLRETGIDPNKSQGGRMALSMVLMLLGAFFMMFVFQHTFLAYRDAYNLDAAGATYNLSYAEGAMGGFFIWLGFILPVQFGLVGWEGKSWKLLFVNAGYYLVAFMIVAMIFAWAI